MKLRLFHIFRHIFDENLSSLLRIAALRQVFLKPESAAFLSTNFKIPDLFAHFYVILVSGARDFHVTFEELLFDISVNYGNVI